jgi:Skp family chaperone for outer membrane proteins
LISVKQQDEQDLKKEKALSEFNKKTVAYTETWNDTNSNRQKDAGEVSRTFDYALTE